MAQPPSRPPPQKTPRQAVRQALRVATVRSHEGSGEVPNPEEYRKRMPGICLKIIFLFVMFCF